jgi:hypothetical protein
MLMLVCFLLLIVLAASVYIFWPSKKQEPELDPVAQKLFDYFTGKTDYVEIDGLVIGPPEQEPNPDIGMEPRLQVIPINAEEQEKPVKEEFEKFCFTPPKRPKSLTPEWKEEEKNRPGKDL